MAHVPSGVVSRVGRKHQWLVVLALIAEGACRLEAALVRRGPYLQQGTPHQVIVQWRTDVPAGSFVRYGTNPAALTSLAGDFVPLTNHIVTVSNLEPATRYHYEIGTGTEWFPAAPDQHFITAPPVGPPRSTRVWILGDSGDPGLEAAMVRDAFAAYAATTRPPDLWLMLGDNAYGSGRDTEYQAAVFDFYPQFLRNTVLWPTIGNHDRDPVYFSIFTLPQNGEAGGVPSGTEKYYSFDYAHIHFICLDSYSSLRTNGSAMNQWLEADLAATTQPWIIAYWHHPPYTKGTHDSDTEGELIEMRTYIVPILESYGVDLVLSGHSHNYERSYLLDGHYGLSTTLAQSMKKNAGSGREDGDGAYVKPGLAAHEGTVYTVAGCSAMSSAPDPMPAMFISLDQIGSVILDVDTNRLEFRFLQGNGLVGDYFTMLKTPPPPAEPPAAPTNLVAMSVDTNRIDLAWNDASTNEEGFKIERSTDGVEFAPLATVGANVIEGADLGLAPDTIYFYRARAFNRAGDSPYSNLAQATTPPIPPDLTPPAAITTLTLSAATSNSVTLFWIAPGDDGAAGRATRYELRHGLQPLGEGNWTSAVLVAGLPAPMPAGELQGITVGGLVEDTPYWFGLKAADEVDNLGPLSNVMAVRTPRADGRKHAVFLKPALVSLLGSLTPVEPPFAPSDLAATALASNVVRLTWRDHADSEEYFAIDRSTNGIAFTRIGQVGANVTMTLDQSVWPEATFFYRVSAGRAGVESVPSGTAQATTPPVQPPDTRPPAAVTNLRAVQVGANAVTLTWTAPGDDAAAGTAAGYDLRYSTSAITVASWPVAIRAVGTPAPSPSGSTQVFTVGGLDGGTTYRFALRSRDEAGNESPLSNVPSVTTTGLPPPWLGLDVGPVALAGSSSHAGGVFTVRGAGLDIGGTNDQFHFIHQPAVGDCEIIARVTDLDDTAATAKAGVMIRDSLLPGAKLAMLTLTPGERIQWLRRTANNGSLATTTAVGSFPPSQWLRVVRVGNQLTGYYSANGLDWTPTEPKTVNFGTNIWFGLAVTSASTNVLNTARFDRVQAAP